MSATIAVAVDFSKHSQTVVQAASGLAQDLGANILLVHALTDLPAPAGDMATAGGPTLQAEQDMHEAIRMTQQWAEQLRADDLQVEVVAEHGDPAQVILVSAKSHDATMIVLGSHGRGAIARAFLGSVATRVIKEADRPVLVVPARMSS